jgi:hypothetical protein
VARKLYPERELIEQGILLCLNFLNIWKLSFLERRKKASDGSAFKN